jgi:hypothetical protein
MVPIKVKHKPKTGGLGLEKSASKRRAINNHACNSREMNETERLLLKVLIDSI